jgi:hypothetical protein
MAITQTLTNSYKVDLLSGGMNFNTANRALTLNTQDVFKIALYTSLASLDATTTAYTATGEVANGGGYTTGGLVLTINQVPVTGATPTTTAYINFVDAVWLASTISASGALIYNSSNANKSVAVLSFGGTKTSNNSAFTVQFPPSGVGSSIIQIA